MQGKRRAKIRKALITGAAGFAGSHLADFLFQQANVEVFAIDRPQAKLDNIRHLADKIKFFHCDICDFKQVRQMLSEVRPDYVFHLAAQAYVPDSWISPIVSLNTNAVGTLNILEAVRTLKLPARVQIACSADEYGRVFKNEVPIKETNQFRPLSPYAVGKITQDMLGYQYYQSYQMHIVRTRAFNHLGPRMAEVYMASNFAKQIALIEQGRQEPVILAGDLEVVRDFTDVRDMVRGYWFSLTKCPPGEVYNICSGKGLKIRAVLDMLLGFSPAKIKIKKDKSRYRPSDVTVLVGDGSKFRRQTHWRPRIPIKQSLEDILHYWRRKV